MPSGRTRNNVSNIFYWNHVSDKLTLSEKAELKAHYLTNHRKCFAYKKAHKDFKEKKKHRQFIVRDFCFRWSSHRSCSTTCGLISRIINQRLYGSPKPCYKNPKYLICLSELSTLIKYHT